MRPSDGHSRRICKILKSEWWRQVRTFKDLLRIACANGMDGHPGYRQYRQWCNVADSTSEFLWRTVRPTLPVQKKGNPVQGHVLNLSTTPIPEEHERVLGLGPKYCFEPHLNPFEKIATARAVSRCAKEDERSSLRLDGYTTALLPCWRLRENELPMLCREPWRGFCLVTSIPLKPGATWRGSSVEASSSNDALSERAPHVARVISSAIDVLAVMDGCGHREVLFSAAHLSPCPWSNIFPAEGRDFSSPLRRTKKGDANDSPVKSTRPLRSRQASGESSDLLGPGRDCMPAGRLAPQPLFPLRSCFAAINGCSVILSSKSDGHAAARPTRASTVLAAGIPVEALTPSCI
ncbi:hypothetical protein HPB50_026258 [Hyalomma asiaticum]|uniref:Uncharacterized protein n=1 Tax=Hyalomma asiaticum TaxID=266040 RepID=A0ACB7SL03_HYAAI|nr:hypothetical protein HPB50_026258 [Hyalomma asiaticum]